MYRVVELVFGEGRTKAKRQAGPWEAHLDLAVAKARDLAGCSLALKVTVVDRSGRVVHDEPLSPWRQRLEASSQRILRRHG